LVTISLNYLEQIEGLRATPFKNFFLTIADEPP